MITKNSINLNIKCIIIQQNMLLLRFTHYILTIQKKN